MKDMLGQEIKVGMWGVKPGRASSSVWLDVGVIVEVTEDSVVWRSVQNTSWATPAEFRLGRKARIGQDKFVVIPTDSVPQTYRQLLEVAS